VNRLIHPLARYFLFRIFDNIEQPLLDALLETMQVAQRGDFCVGYFNLRGWKQLDRAINDWAGGEGHCCRLLVGMQRLPQEDLQDLFRLDNRDEGIDNSTASRRKKELVDAFRNQLTWGAPSNEDEAGLRRLAAQIKARKVIVKLFLAHPLHAKLYLLFRPETVNPAVGFVGSSNLTLAGLSRQGELNVDVLDHDACAKLARWFEDRWNDPWCLDISNDLVRVIDESWAREIVPPPYHIYVKMAYHLSQEARTGVSEFRIPRDFGNKLFEFQVKAVQIAAHHLNKRGGVLIGDVVGLGKTLMATALARIFEDDHDLETLILCPRNLVPMWEDYRSQYRLRGRVLSISMARRVLPGLPRHRLVLIDESHNLRNREGKTYRAIRDYIDKNDSKCILLSATPYNKTYLDLSNQLRLFIPEEQDLGVRPERLLRELGETEFLRRYQCGIHTLAAFEKSAYADDWRELMRLFLVRRTRGFIKQHYAQTDPQTGRKYLTAADDTHMPFPERLPRTIKIRMDRKNGDPYARLYDVDVVDTINRLNLPRYGLAHYIDPSPKEPASRTEDSQLANLSRAGRRLMGFCRTNLFKRLESSGQAFLLSLERHILRNFVFLHALQNDLSLPIGTQDAELLDTRFHDEDDGFFDQDDDENGDSSVTEGEASQFALRTEEDFARRAAEIYQHYAGPLRKRFAWLRASLFVPMLAQHLRADVRALLGILRDSGSWDPDTDGKLKALVKLLTRTHPDEKVIVFTQFADTVHYLAGALRQRGISRLEGVTGSSADPTALAWRFSPVSNNKHNLSDTDQELRVLVATDVLSEGQNLQDAAIVVNYDLPWAIIRLIQRAGRVDRIGQKSEQILCYSFLPAEGVNRIIRLRERVRQRLRENAEVVGTDEAFFEDDRDPAVLQDLYNERAGLLDGDADTEIDLSSHAYQIWNDAINADPTLEQTIRQLPNVVYSTKAHTPTDHAPEGVLVYLRTAQGNDALAWLDREGKSITESQFAILDAASCAPDAPALPRLPDHHRLVQRGVEAAAKEEKQVGGQLGRPGGARFRTYERLRNYSEAMKGGLFVTPELLRTIGEIYRFPLCESARDTLNRQLKAGIDDLDLADLVLSLRREGRLCQVQEGDNRQEPQIICSLGLSARP
jgi:superfamily II DNA or RNA helicase